MSKFAIVAALGVNPAPVTEIAGSDEQLFELFGAVKANKAAVTIENGVLSASLSKGSVRAIKRAQKAERQAEIKDEIEAALEAKRPQKIGPIVSDLAKARGITDDSDKKKFRGEVLEALRAMREEGTVRTDNATNSNFHATHTLAAKPDAFPVPEPEPETTEEAETSEATPEAEVQASA